ncbi:uncharacterized protein G2W53_028700 [Senna tora]|uniref:Uncharacterized protein n=1 Tax=Senna tora TaxID=362788 RepID=A0A834WD26_9FABA|nr:uncharacterized protein G2W53_028700 [Senna tora]
MGRLTYAFHVRYDNMWEIPPKISAKTPRYKQFSVVWIICLIKFRSGQMTEFGTCSTSLWKLLFNSARLPQIRMVDSRASESNFKFE